MDRQMVLRNVPLRCPIFPLCRIDRNAGYYQRTIKPLCNEGKPEPSTPSQADSTPMSRNDCGFLASPAYFPTPGIAAESHPPHFLFEPGEPLIQAEVIES